MCVNVCAHMLEGDRRWREKKSLSSVGSNYTQWVKYKNQKIAIEAYYLKGGKCQNIHLKESKVVSCRVVERGGGVFGGLLLYVVTLWNPFDSLN